MRSYDIAIAGATGAVGKMVLSILEERKFPVKNLSLLASKKSAGESIIFNNKSYPIKMLSSFDFHKAQICFFCTGNEISAQYVPKAAKAGAIVIDKSAYFRYDDKVALIVPEVNATNLLEQINKSTIIANPNCSTIPVVIALKPLYDAVGIKRIEVATYQSVSGSGVQGVEELATQTSALLNLKPIKSKVYPAQIAFNVIPFIDELLENDYTREEMKITWEIQKILNDYKIKINATAVRVPVFYGHSAAVHIETKKKITKDNAIALLKKMPGIKVKLGDRGFTTPIGAAGKDSVYVGRIRESLHIKNGLNFWVTTDNLRKGAALNAIQIAEILIK